MYPDNRRIAHVRSLLPSECRRAARLHASGLPEDFFVRFGEDFLERYYRASLDSPFARTLAATDPESGEVSGILLGTLDTPAHSSFLLRRHGFSLARIAAARCLTDPAFALEWLRSRASRYTRGILRSLMRQDRSQNTPATTKVALLAHLVVDEERRSSGIGRALVESFEDQSAEAGVKRLELVTRPSDRNAGAFYERLGWTYVGSRSSRSGEAFEFYVKPLDD